MAQETNNNEDEIEKLRIENEIRKMKLTLEKGAHFGGSTELSKLHPELESNFLNYIEEFEKAYDKSKQISVFDYLGKPKYRDSDTIPDDKIGSALKRIMNLMNKNGVSLETLCNVDDRILYRFITTELFFEKIDDMKLEGMNTCFIYEDFHPNHDYDIRNSCNEFINAFLDKDCDYDFEMKHLLSKQAENNIGFKNFRDSYQSFTLHNFEINEVAFDAKKATTSFDINFSAKIEGCCETKDFIGAGKIIFKYTYGYWYINKVNLPTISL